MGGVENSENGISTRKDGLPGSHQVEQALPMEG